MTQNVGLLFGGESEEHEVSVASAQGVAESLLQRGHNIAPIGITKTGIWKLLPEAEAIFNLERVMSETEGSRISAVPGRDGHLQNEWGDVIDIDVIFPLLHGPMGEDGTVQGFLEATHVPYVGADPLGSAMAMDKEITNKLLDAENISSPNWMLWDGASDFRKVQNRLGETVFVKPARLGSSVGISKVSDEQDFRKAVRKAGKYDDKVVVEEYIEGREIECSVLEEEEMRVSQPGEVVPGNEFYDYEAKYDEGSGTELKVPVELPDSVMLRVQNLSKKVFRVLNLRDLARVDFFLTEDERLYVNEVNTIPGFTPMSMYPKLWEVSGIEYGELCQRLVRTAHARR